MSIYAQCIETPLMRISGKWKLELLYTMAGGAIRWKSLVHSLPKAAPNVLTRQLRQMETDNMVVRRVVSTSPPQIVEYELTEEGKRLRPILSDLHQWETDSRQNQTPSCPLPDFSVSSRVLSSRWMLSIMTLLHEPTRFGCLQQQLEGISRSVLAAQLQELCDMKLLSQTRHTCFPPRVEYALTAEGKALIEILSRIPKILN